MNSRGGKQAHWPGDCQGQQVEEGDRPASHYSGHEGHRTFCLWRGALMTSPHRGRRRSRADVMTRERDGHPRERGGHLHCDHASGQLRAVGQDLLASDLVSRHSWALPSDLRLGLLVDRFGESSQRRPSPPVSARAGFLARPSKTARRSNQQTGGRSRSAAQAQQDRQHSRHLKGVTRSSCGGTAGLGCGADGI